MKVIIAAAGTGGHINPGIAIANKIKDEEKDSEVIFIGTDRGLEKDLVPRAGYKLETIEAYGLTKEFSLSNLKKMYKTFKGVGEARKIIENFKPDIIIGTGGYICGSVVTAARKYNHNIPVLLHESNSFPGKAIRMLAPKADTILVSFEEAKEKIENCKNVVLTGTPVKIKKQNYSKNQIKEILDSVGLNSDKPIVLIFGGSQGAQRINDTVINILKKGLNKNYQIIWATGPKQYDIIKEILSKNNMDIENIPNSKILPYIYNMEEIENVSDMIVSRSGAMTISEIANLGKPSILIPLPNVSNDHQMHNAKVLENIDAGKIITNDELNEVLLNNTIESIVLDKRVCEQMGKNAFKVSTTDVEEKIYKEIKKLV